MQKKHAHIILEEEKATLNLCTKFSNTHLKIFRTVIIFIYHARHRDGSSRIKVVISFLKHERERTVNVIFQTVHLRFYDVYFAFMDVFLSFKFIFEVSNDRKRS
jgi:hypothetical protein